MSDKTITVQALRGPIGEVDLDICRKNDGLGETEELFFQFRFFFHGIIFPLASYEMKHCCESLRRTVEFKGSNLSFDPIFVEYEMKVENHSMLVFFCPFCGAKAPESKRGEFFTTVTNEEKNRLLKIVKDCKTKKDIVQICGEPDWEHPATQHFDDLFKKEYEYKAGALFSQLSDTGDLYVTFDEAEKIIKKAIRPKSTRDHNKRRK